MQPFTSILLAMVLAGVACGAGPATVGSPAAPTCPRATATATPEPRKITATNQILDGGDARLAFHASFDVVYTRPASTTARVLFSVNCDRKRRSCTGQILRLDAVDAGRPLGFWDINTMEDAHIVDDSGQVAIIRWGPLRTFTVDIQRGTVVYVESGDEVYGRAETVCTTGL